MAAVKANAYGHGLLPVARALTDADALAVARLSEALALREGGIATPILLLSGVACREDLKTSAHLDCWLVVHSLAQVELLEQAGEPIERVWLKIDTGMRRLGVKPEDVPGAVARLKACDRVAALGLMTHLANADDPDDGLNERQVERFMVLAEDADLELSLANSASILARAHKDWAEQGIPAGTWVRPGLALYGASPFGVSMDALRPVMQLETALLDVKPISAGDAVGYGSTWRAPQDTVLGVAAVGYGDGYSRHLPSGTPVLVNERQASLAGRVSMDLIAIDLGPDAKDRSGDRVVLWGEDLPVEQIARCAGTIAYTLLTGVTARVPREYD